MTCVNSAARFPLHGGLPSPVPPGPAPFLGRRRTSHSRLPPIVMMWETGGLNQSEWQLASQGRGDRGRERC